ncbi:hypothetical protein QO002_005844 [Pararhizobium capsulatum DSM 1112]|uniref:Uncharacterized protein n=1 Tax=Pararhizobium capsulatum DSM 1112 TaxID=1121113 RepID=A0ABU0BZF0_9HYPH|nr:hypothetical protein [Pararhizobium capsulatum]MDQ0323637.1 hypothetical protein [Pararhizobium capsulatum DSM 1112]
MDRFEEAEVRAVDLAPALLAAYEDVYSGGPHGHGFAARLAGIF